uniref:Cadherin domain-containing protein n=1 Tax=Xiphophorus couchianus TaxID=32473 RepID=A0A3B5MLS0_9TELE
RQLLYQTEQRGQKRKARASRGKSLHTDLDKGDSSVKYTLSGDGAGSIFTIDQTTGDIHALRSLDREEKPYYTLRAQAVDIDTNIPLEPESEFVIKVQDINDNEPKFLEGPYTASVPEMSPVGKRACRVLKCLQYTINIFMLCCLPNLLRCYHAVWFKKKTKSSPDSTEQQLLALVCWLNTAATWHEINHCSCSKTRAETNLLIVGLNVPVGGGMSYFRLHVAGTETEEERRKQYLGTPLDYETKKAYTFKVEASNAHLDPRFQSFGAFKDTATVKINVLDVDEPPVFNKPSYVMDVYEDTPAGTIIGAVTAQDLDASSSPVRYSIDWKSDLDSYFDIDPVEGTISTNELLDRENIAQHNISVVATKLSDRVAVTVHVLDINEFPPELASPYETFVCENSKVGQVSSLLTSLCSFQHAVSLSDNTAGIVTKRSGFRRRLQEIYFLPVVIEDNGYPPKSSTGTLTIRVCGCELDGSLLTCSAEAIFLPVGLSTGALIAILLCIVILLVIVVLYMGLRRQKKKETLMSSKEDIRDNVIHYDDEGGGEEDTHAFDMGTLRNPKVVKENLYRRDIKPEMQRGPKPPASQDSSDIRDFINQRLKEHDTDNSAPPYDSLATYAYEGNGSVAESLSSIESLAVDFEEDYDYLSDWGPHFKTLAGIFGEQSETHSDSTNTENTH